MSTTTLKQMLSPDVTEALTLNVPTGSHDHAIDPGLTKTLIGGAHRHTFRIPAGELLVTDLSGPHGHDIYVNEEGDEAYTYGGGEHVHTITLEDGSVIKTEIDGWHCHEFNLKAEQEAGTPESSPTGQHRHRLVLPNGAVIMSLMPGDELMELSTEAGIAAHRANMSKGYPSAPNSEGVAEVVVREKSASIRLTLGFDTHKHFIDLECARKGVEVESAAAAVEGFGLHGYRCMTPVVGETCKARVSKRASAGDAAQVDALAVTWGLQTEVSREVFLKGEHFFGTLTLRKGASGWAATFERVVTPAVLVKGAALPPKGYSALPATLAKACPREFAYWETENPMLARQQRDALAVSGFFAAESLALVGGDVVKVERVTTTHLYEAGGERPVLRTYADEVRKLLPRGATEVVVQTTGQHWEDLAAPAGAVRVIDAASIEEIESLAKCEEPYLVIAADSPDVRRALEKCGQTFVLAHPDADGKVLCSSYDLSKAGSMAAVSLLPLTEPVAAPVAVTVIETGKAAPAPAEPVKGTLRLLSKAIGDVEEERYVLGVVLEPLTEANPDAQGDIYDAATVKKAAHSYMEHFQNVGLQHKEMVSDRVKLVESYIAPCQMNVAGTVVKAGSWVMAVRVDDDDLWGQVKSGAITGFSIGGWATRTPVDAGAAA
jgi:hypothetical protein